MSRGVSKTPSPLLFFFLERNLEPVRDENKEKSKNENENEKIKKKKEKTQ